MPMSKEFEARLNDILPAIIQRFSTPFHIYNEAGIRETGARIRRFLDDGFGPGQEFFAVKALPDPAILAIMHDMGFGFDCSSIPELRLARQAGAAPKNIMFTSNNTTPDEFAEAAKSGGCILNLDDVTLIDKAPPLSQVLNTACFRYNPGPERTGNAIIGNPVEAKYGITSKQVVEAYQCMQNKGAEHYGFHTMVCTNELDYTYMVETVRGLLKFTSMLKDELGIELDFINMGGGLGIPYKPDQSPIDLDALQHELKTMYHEFLAWQGYVPKLYVESGRLMTGPHGVLVTTCINQKHTYREYRGVDASMSALMRPGMYGAYHHVTVLGGEDRATEVVDVVGPICENCDKFAVQRELPKITEGDIVIIHDTGAHGIAMGFNYNGRLRPQELLLRQDGSVELIRRAETINDLSATLHFKPKVLRP